MAGEIIRLGDTTSHNGTVLEGSMQDICHGKPIAYIGHKVHCPKCKGDYPIVEGAMTTTFYGKGVALAGMKTSCGATLIPSQFTDTVEYGQGKSSAAAAGASPKAAAAPPPVTAPAASKALAGSGVAQSLAASEDAAEAEQKFDLFFHAKDANQASLANVRYRIVLDDGREFIGKTDKNGHTEKVISDYAQNAKIEIPYYDHSHTHAANGSDTCSC
ncbi:MULTISPECIES: PAAR domain-containing protein [unclassified Duganella]|uniref:PAAR domain-containing protein n=1 Tax=unclassified Duganella TaxID=2636909 RepID=UPI0009EA005F|nr:MULTISPECIES: PAAR domain-containing protein [unclassified Duganella]